MSLEQQLRDTADALAAKGKGILAADESNGTIGKRFSKLGIENVEENRRSFREVLLTADFGAHISGVITFEETLRQRTTAGERFVDVLKSKQIQVGIKVDQGLRPLPGSQAETFTLGLDTLESRCQSYIEQGATFAKWRAAIKIDRAAGLPTEYAIETNAHDLARYAATCQACGLVPLVEPEILIDGTHGRAEFEAVTERVLSATVAALRRQRVLLEGCLLKPMMVLPGDRCPAPPPSADEIAEATLRVMRRVVPAAIPGIMFLSGGQSEAEATANLNAIALAALRVGRAPWALSFSFGRALQASVLELWRRDPARVDECRAMAAALAEANSRAQRGEFSGQHPSLLASGSLVEGFRGWSAAAPAPQ